MTKLQAKSKFLKSSYALFSLSNIYDYALNDYKKYLMYVN